jgi:hypothetical protein
MSSGDIDRSTLLARNPNLAKWNKGTFTYAYLESLPSFYIGRRAQ